MEGSFISLTRIVAPVELQTIVVGALQENCYVAWRQPDQAVVIDPGDEAPKIIRTLESHRLTPRLILNTHGHFDHIGAVEELKRVYGAPYKIHAADEAIIAMVPARTRLFGVVTPEHPTPTGHVRPGERFTLGDLEFEAIHTPGHTPGGMCYYFPREHAVFTGDTLFLQSIGRSDFPGGDGALLLRSIREKLLTLPPQTTVYPGHGPPTTIGDEAEANPFLA